MPPRLSWLLSALFLLAPTFVSASVLAIDYGTDFTKVSLMKPGVPFDVVLDRDSKRKIASSVAWKGEQRLFGADAVNIAPRFPSESFSSLKYLQGVEYDSPNSHYHATVFPQLHVSPSPRNTHSFKRKDGSEWSNEELVAMQFAYFKELAESVGNERVRDAIVTVPAWYSQFERQAVIDSLELAGLRGLALVNDGTAVAVNYAMSRTFPQLEHHIIYDAGSSGIRATVVSFQTIPGETASKSKSKSKTTDDVTNVEVRGFGYDKYASGTEMDRRIREILRGAFETKHGRGRTLEEEPKALAKLWKEAARAKTILSANAESSVTIESFVWDIDFRTAVSRNAFEEACADLVPHFVQPIHDAIANTGLTLDDISSVVLAGGVSRVPMVQAAIKAVVGDKLAHNVNADEAAVLGAAFYGASLSRQFRTKAIKVEDLTSHDVQVSYPAESKLNARTINTSILPTGTKYGARKTLTFKRKEDFNLTLTYKHGEAQKMPSKIFEAELVGITEAIANLTERGATEPVVKITVVLSESGLALVEDAHVYGEVKDDSFAGKLKGLFGGNSSSSSSASTTEGAEASSDTASTTDASAAEASPTPAKAIPNTIPLTLNIRHLSLAPMTSDQKLDSRKRLVSVDVADKTRQKKEEARNHLEGYLYRLRDLLDGAETTPFFLFSKPEERAKLSEKHRENYDWFSENAEDAPAAEFWTRREALEALEKPIQFRYQENEDAPQELENLQKALTAGRFFVVSAKQNRTAEEADGLPHKYTEEEIEDVTKRLIETETWLGTNIEKQKALLKNDDPVLLSTEMKARGVALQNQVMKLQRKKTPKPTKKATTTSAESSSTANGTGSETTTVVEPSSSEQPRSTGASHDDERGTRPPKEEL